MNKKYIIAVIVILALAVGLAACLRYIIREPAVRFSEPSAFQESAFYLELHSGLFGGSIYYTLDGETPTLQSEIYQEPILIEEGLPNHVTVVKAALLHGGKLGRVYTQTYFVGKGASELFDVMVVSLSADKKDLYDEETGILSNYTEKGEEGEWDRPAYVEFYEADGAAMLAQGTGIAVSGNGSRTYDQKSIKLIADSVYDREHPTFDYDFFDTDMAGNQSGQSYNRLVLRNGGSDHEGTMLKWNVVSRLGKEAGILCVGARPGILFLNGEYYGIIQLQEKYSRYNTAHAIGTQKDDIEKFEPNEINSSRFGGYYGRLHQDLNNPERQQALEQSVDMTDLLKHYGMNMIMNNVDWPFHNFLSWRCKETSSSPYGDGRVRFFLYDLDAAYQDTSDLEITNVFDYLMEDPMEDINDTFYLLMQSELYRTQFVNMVCDLTATIFKEEHVLQIVEEENQKLSRSIKMYYAKDKQKRQQDAVQKMEQAVAESCRRVHEGLKEHLGANYPYTLRVEAPGDAEISFGQIQIESGKSYTGNYYHNYPLTLTASSKEGKDILGWIVNGKQTDTRELLLDESYDGETIYVQLVTEP